MKERRKASVVSLLLMAASMLIPALGAAEVIFHDSFESGDLRSTGREGFRWTGSARTDVTTADAKTGQRSLRFRYPEGVSHSEQRFNLGTPRRELWIRYWVKVPSNYMHTDLDPIPTNRKFFAIWSETYSGEGAVGMTFEFWQGGGGSDSRLAWHHPRTKHQDHFQFIRIPQDRGRWMEVTIHLKMASSAAAADGVLRLWQRWDGESTATLRFSRNDLQGQDYYPGPGEANGFLNGYLMGYANEDYTTNTDWLIDDFTLSTTPFNDMPGGKNIAAVPKAPANLVVE